MVHMVSLNCSLAAAVGYANLVQSQPVTTAEAVLNGHGISGVIRFTTAKLGPGLNVDVEMQGLGPDVQYNYLIRVNPVPSDGDCLATSGVLDPTRIMNPGAPYRCDPNEAATTCAIGDLSGIFGSMVGSASGTFTAQYAASLLATNGPNIIMSHSVVIHGADGVRMAYANIMPIEI